MNPFTEVKKIGKIMPIGSNSLHRKHILEIFIKKRMRISNSTFLILEVKSCLVLGFDNTNPYSLESIAVNYFDDLRKLTTGQNTEYYLTDLFQELGKTTEVYKYVQYLTQYFFKAD